MPTASAVKKMKHWVDIFEPALDYDFLPSMRAIGGAIIYNKSYFVSSRTRKDRPHLIFQYTLQGEAEMALGQKKFRCPEGTGFLCYSHDPELTYYYPEECNEELHTVYFCLYGAEAIGRELIQKYGHVFHLDRNAAPIREALQRMRSEDNARSFCFTKDQKMRLASSFLSALTESVESHNAINPIQKLVDEAKKMMMKDATRRLSIAEIAEALSVTPEHLARAFRKKCGLTPLQYYEEQRMQLAEQLLNQGRLQVREIAASLGYEYPGHFIRTFKRVTGRTPGESRPN